MHQYAKDLVLSDHWAGTSLPNGTNEGKAALTDTEQMKATNTE